MRAALLIALFGFGVTLGLNVGQYIERQRERPVCNKYGATIWPQALHFEIVCDYKGRLLPCVKT